MIAEMMDDNEDASEENDIATLRNMLARAMADENYNRARQYMNLIETIENEDEPTSPYYG